MSERRKVVVTGIGPVTPIGIGVDDFWEGHDAPAATGSARITPFDHSTTSP